MIWTPASLQRLAADVLHGRKFLVVSNREPWIHSHHNGRVVCTQPAGGLTAALTPIVAAAGGTWVAHGSGSADRVASGPCGRVIVPQGRTGFTLRRVWIDPQLHNAYYAGLSNQALWPLCHNVYQRPVFRGSDWQAYRAVNRLFADAVLDEAGDSPAIVFVQDYHLALLPRMLRRSGRDIVVGQFWHIPWPAVEIVQTFPWVEELLDGLLANDLIGFHLDRHCRNFMEAAACTLGARADAASGRIWRTRESTRVQAAPVGIDFDRHSTEAAAPAVTELMNEWQRRIGHARRIALGIDRLDYTKGLPERLRAFALTLERRPELRGHIVMVQVAVPSRSGIPEFAALESEIDRQAAAINDRWSTAEWRPVIIEKRNLDSAEMMALHRLANACLVTSLHDGMNLVAKEFAASRFDGDGVLVLSRFAGAARELSSAIQVNPFSEDSIAGALIEALNMPEAERHWRMSRLRASVRGNNVYRWGAAMLEAFAEASSGSVMTASRLAPDRLAASVA